MRVWPDGATLTRALDETTVVVAARGAAAGCARLLGAALVVPPGATGDAGHRPARPRRARRVDAIARGARARRGPRRRRPTRRPTDATRAAKVARARARSTPELLAPLAHAVAARGRHARRLPRPRHATRSTARTTPLPCRALRWGAGIAPAGPRRMTEAACARAPVRPPAWPLYGAARVEAAA